MADQKETQSSQNRSVTRQGELASPFAPFRREMERLFEDFFNVFGMPARWDRELAPPSPGIIAPRMDVSETDDEIRIKAELPGVNEKDVDIRLVDDVLTIRAECQTERKDQQQDYRIMERSRGTFVRSLHLPFRVNGDQIQASLTDGVLSIIIPKTHEARERVQRIEVKRQDLGRGGESQPNQRASSETPSTAEQEGAESAAE
jgi:HSP20 family protein